jgi:uncharacterized protein (TIGR02145 family)
MRTKILVLSFALALSANLRAQVTIGELVEPTSGALLDLNKAVKGGLALSVVDLPNFYTIPNGFPGIASQADVTPAVKSGFRGAMVYNTGVTSPPTGIYVWNGTNWAPATDNCLPAENLTLSLKASSNAPVLNTPVTFTVSSNVSARCAGSETYTWSVPGANASDYTVLSTVDNRATIQFITADAYTVRVEVRNPYSTGSASVETTVLAGGVVPASMKTSGYYLTGKPCYDINKSDTYDSRHVATTAPARVATATDFSVSANRTRTYKFCHENYTNLSVSLLEDNGNLVESISQPASSDQTGISGCKTFTVTFKDNVESLVNGNGYSVKLLASYTDKDGYFKLADMEISVQDGLCGCPVRNSATQWSTFQCHNLGADYDIMSDADLAGITNTNFYEYHGDWYRFGAKNVSLENTAATKVSSIANWSSNTNSYYPFQDDTQDWLPANDPCPSGWRLPTYDEWLAVTQNNTRLFHVGTTICTNYSEIIAAGGMNENNDAIPACCYNNGIIIGDYLYLPLTGYRMHDSGQLHRRGYWGYNWSSRANQTINNYGYYLNISANAYNLNSRERSAGVPVRCISSE